ncbi:unnamed protein product [Clonostachys rosea]|uniref:Uncharacterized protein n=1 Tax=Bionectria ochroleuca TaxID=29856 RepID=A0ABY6ULL6_BIOOC|nr:unnamed protein product [Clonostachys rosea]
MRAFLALTSVLKSLASFRYIHVADDTIGEFGVNFFNAEAQNVEIYEEIPAGDELGFEIWAGACMTWIGDGGRLVRRSMNDPLAEAFA